MANGYNPSVIRIQRMLGANRPIQAVRLPHPSATPRIGGAINPHMLMRPGREAGGIVDSPASPFTGGIMSTGAGRADDVQMHVPNGAYVMPAWAVSHIGEGNTINGLTQLKMMFGSPWGGPKTPYGAPSPALSGKRMGPPKPPPMASEITMPQFLPKDYAKENPALAQPRQAHGGAARSGDGPVPINASGGEFVIDPAEVARIGDGNVNKGHLILDKWVLKLKKEAADTIRKLPGPAR